MLDNYGIRTDLALEATERFTEENVEVRGVEIHEDYNEEKDWHRKRGEGHGASARKLYYNRSPGAFYAG